MTDKTSGESEQLLRSQFERPGEREKRVARHLAERTHISRNVSEDLDGQVSFGQKMADQVAQFGGSWTFIGLFAVVMVVWVLLNSFILVRLDKAFDPYPYILLNLFLSMLAAIQAPVILMSQNRQGYKDRLSAEHDYEVNLKAELEIKALHEKLDVLREHQWGQLISIQQEQLRLLAELIGDLRKNRPEAEADGASNPQARDERG
ncbi:MAG: DUF1003 domain-containing protein [Vicinamibacterales bacterium]